MPACAFTRVMSTTLSRSCAGAVPVAAGAAAVEVAEGVAADLVAGVGEAAEVLEPGVDAHRAVAPGEAG